MQGSKIFRRHKAVGYISNNIPALTRYIPLRKDTFIVTCIGRAFQIFSTSHFRLLHVSGYHPDVITSMAQDKLYVYTASNKCIYAWRGGRHIKHTLKGHKKNIHLLLPFGQYLLSVDEENIVKIWSLKTEDVYLEIPFKESEFKVTALMHPPTYINKILFGSEQGIMHLWNINENKLIYTFKMHDSRINILETTPAIDVAAIGFQDGKIILLNLKYDEVVMKFSQDWGPVTGISFRTDGHPIMATSSSNGNVALWNLEERKIMNHLKAHHDTVTTVICYPNEPLMLTTSPDNSMKLWIFDMSDGGARLLRIREGHSAPPLCIRYHGNKGVHILSSGEDSSVRIFNTLSESLSKSMGRASYNKKASKKKSGFQEDPLIMPPIIYFTSETTRDKEWDNIAAIHSGLVQTTTWSFDKQRMGTLRLVPEKFQNKTRKVFNSEATCITLTHCGNFVIIGYSSGDLERFNIQSGIHRATYGKPAHSSAVRGVACDNLNQYVISGDSEGIVKFWNFKENISYHFAKIRMSNGVSLMEGHRESGMLCIALDNFVIYILDTDTKQIVRKFEGHTGKINDATFSPDSRWLITAAMDSTIKVWDIPSSYMIDHFKVDRPCISLTMSPTGDSLATAHVNHLGIYLWSNKSLFDNISLRSIDPFSEASYIDLPSHAKDSLALEESMNEMEIGEIDDEGEEVNLSYTSPNQLSEDLLTLSGLPETKWQNLLDLDIIKRRNKPKQPLKVPKQAPFFLPTVAGPEINFDLSNEIAAEKNSKLLTPVHFNNLTTFGKLLHETITSENYEKCIEHLKSLGPSMIDFEIKSLHLLSGGSHEIMLQFLHMILCMFNSKKNFELAQAYLALFLKVNGRNLVENSDMMDLLKKVEEIQNQNWKRLEEKFLYGLGVISALRNYVK